MIAFVWSVILKAALYSHLLLFLVLCSMKLSPPLIDCMY